MLPEDLKTKGWASVPGVDTREQMLSLAKSLGRPTESDDGHLVKMLEPLDSNKARSNSLSSYHGLGAFPLHTDTAFWPEPCRYLVLRVLGDNRRVTTVVTFDIFFKRAILGAHSLADQSVWLLRTGRKKFYCSMHFSSRYGKGWRYDPLCMLPVNRSANTISREMHSLAHSGGIGFPINWEHGTAVVIDNWMALHGRGDSPANEGARVLERIYVSAQ
jgi:hypothetical protein